MRTLGANLTTHLATTAHTRCKMLRLALKDGSILAVTDHDRELSFDIGDGAETYSPETGITPSDLSLSVGLGGDDMEITGPLVDTATEAWHVTKTAILGGRFDDAVAHYFQVNWNALADGAIKLLKGRVVLAEIEGGRFKLTIHSEASKFSQEIGRIITPYCDADFGDARCGYSITPLSATVTAATSLRQITVSFTGTYANDYFNKGTVTFTSGALNGTRPVEVSDWTSAGVITLWTELAELPEIGDTLQLRQGCDKTRAACMAYSNILNFRGFPDVPGTDQVLRYPNPG